MAHRPRKQRNQFRMEHIRTRNGDPAVNLYAVGSDDFVMMKSPEELMRLAKQLEASAVNMERAKRRTFLPAHLRAQLNRN